MTRLAMLCKSLQNFPLHLHEEQVVNLDFRDISAFCWLNYMLGEDFEETGLLKAMSSIIKPASVVWDVGANCGKVSYLLARHTPAHRVVFFEPNRSMFEMSLSAVSVFTHVSGYNVALSDKMAEADLAIPRGNSTTATLDPGVTSHVGTTARVECITGDQLIANRNEPAPSVIKIDTEGHEAQVISGLAKTINTHKPVIFFEHLSLSDAQVRDIIPDGYEIFTVDAAEGKLIEGFRRPVGHNSALLPKQPKSWGASGQ